MNVTDVVGALVILAFSAVGFYIGSVRSFSILLGTILAFKMAAGFIDRGPGNYAMIFLGVTAGCAVIGYLVYGATRFHPMDTLEGPLGVILGFCAGWSFARFIYHYYLIFHPDSTFAQSINTSLIAFHIYYITPISSFFDMPAVRRLTKPKI